MRKVDVEISEDVSRSEGGYAVVLLRGVASLPDRASFRIKPVDARDPFAGATDEAWPRGELTPVAVRQTEAGIELVIGPEIVECPALLPGTVGVIEVAAAAVRGEFLWPSIRPTARPKRKHLSIVKPQRAAPAKAAAPVAVPVVAAPVVALPKAEPFVATVPVAAGGVAAAQAVRVPAAEVSVAATELISPAAAASTATVPASVAAPEAASSTEIVTTPRADVGGEATAVREPGSAVQSRGQIVDAVVEPLDETGASIGEWRVIKSASDAGEASPAGETMKPGGQEAPPKVVPPPLDASFSEVRRTFKVPAAGRRMVSVAAAASVLLVGGYVVTGWWSDAGREAGTVAVAKPGQPRVPAVIAGTATVGQPIEGRTSSAGERTAALRPEETDVIDRQYLQPLPGMRPDAQVSVPDSMTSAPAGGERRETVQANAAPAATMSKASEVTLRIRGGGFQVTGELKGFDGAKYVIATQSSGVMTMDASRFECQGDACARPAAAILPTTERPNPLKPDRIAIESAPVFGSALVGQLIKSYAASVAASASEIPASRDQGPRFRISDTRGAELASIEIGANGSAAAISALEQGSAVLAFTERAGDEDARPASPVAAKRAVVSEQLIGFDGVAAIASSRSGLASVSIETLAKLYSGQITDWFELGATPGPITLYLPAENTGTAEAFTKLVLKPRNLRLGGAVTQGRSDAEVAELVARDPQAIGLVSFGAIGGAKALNLETQCGLIVRPTGFSLKAEEYPLVRRLFLASVANPAQPSARGLIRLAQSPEAQRAMVAAGLVDLSLAAVPLAGHSERMASAINAPAAAFDMGEMRQMLTELGGHSRMSINLRFNSAGELDAKSRREIGRLAAALKEAEFAGRKVMLAGFTDAAGKFQTNLNTGLKRAGQVRTALLAAAGPGLDPRLVTAKGYGALAPVACNTSGDGQRLNRRVEVWIGDETPARSAAR